MGGEITWGSAYQCISWMEGDIIDRAIVLGILEDTLSTHNIPYHSYAICWCRTKQGTTITSTADCPNTITMTRILAVKLTLNIASTQCGLQNIW